MSIAGDGRHRVVIEAVRPQLDCGLYPIKRSLGETVVVEADAFTDGHDRIACMLRYRSAPAKQWTEVPMQELGNDCWSAPMTASRIGTYFYTVAAWVDAFLSWQHNFARRRDRADIEAALQVGADLVTAAAKRAAAPDSDALLALARRLGDAAPLEARRTLAVSPELGALMCRHPDRSFETVYGRELEALVDPEHARFSTWYEFFPRSTDAATVDHGTFETAARRLPYVKKMGFDIVYLPPIHPIGRVHRKGANNALTAQDDDPGSPWAIGGDDGGHRAVHPDLGTLEDFRKFRADAERHGIQVALDIAFQASPDHPYVREHSQWFKHRPDGSVQYAENPPKKYEDIYPFDFESSDWRELWSELRGVVEFWIDQEIRIFRVDNPHTKPFAFWQWLIREIRAKHPDVIFLAEAFARPRVMHHLAKLGFNQSYTYFTWRNTKDEITAYFTELTVTECREYFRPNLWPNTPDILHEYLQFGGRPAFMCRAVLAGTLSASYGIYGPAFELLERTPREPGTEEYLDSEKYQIRQWDLTHAESLQDFIARLNRIRRENAALQSNGSLQFHAVDNEQLICYSKHTEDFSNVTLVVANLDPHHAQSGFVELPLADWLMDESRPYQMHDLLSGARYLWHGQRNFVALDPQRAPAHIFRLRRHVATERDFDYFM
jgi:starch synthase (maltosyl-transferring)